MPLSISNSNERLPKGNWPGIWLTVFFLFAVLVASAEYYIRSKGFGGSMADSPQLWSEHRRLASSLGKDALILVGASRMQLGIDLDYISNATGLRPVQLAIDGSSFFPVLKNLANDPSIIGTIIASATASGIIWNPEKDKASEWIAYYERYEKQKLEPYKIIDHFINSWLTRYLAMKLEGAKPALVIYSLAFNPSSSGNYVITRENRSRDADYSKVRMPDFYASRVHAHCGQKEEALKSRSPEEVFDFYRRHISTVQPSKTGPFSARLERLMTLTEKIEKRGGNVIFVRLPSDKLLWEFDKKRFPMELFWNELEKRHPKCVHFQDYPQLSGFHLTDGSHLDFRDKKEFTKGLTKVLLEKNLLH